MEIDRVLDISEVYAYLPFSIGTVMIDDKIPGINSLQLHCFPELVKPGSEIIIKTG